MPCRNLSQLYMYVFDLLDVLVNYIYLEFIVLIFECSEGSDFTISIS